MPDPRDYRQELPGAVWRAYESGEIGGAELWRRLERLWGPDEVSRFIAQRRAA